MSRDKIQRAWRDGWQFVVEEEYFQTAITTEADFRHLLLPGVLKVGESKSIRLRWQRREEHNTERKP